MKMLRCAFIFLSLLIGLASVCMAESWYASMERSSNDYRGSVGAMVTEVDGSKYTPRYTPAELQSTRAVADTRQLAQSGIDVAQARVATNNGFAVPATSASDGADQQDGGGQGSLSITPVCPCFAEDTPIITQNGIKPIAEIKEGDMVLGKDGFKKVYKGLLIEGQTPNLAINDVELVDMHPFIMENGEVKKAGELKQGDKLFNGVEIKKIVKITESTKKIYDLEIEGNNYYVKDMLCQSAHKSE